MGGLNFPPVLKCWDSAGVSAWKSRKAWGPGAALESPRVLPVGRQQIWVLLVTQCPTYASLVSGSSCWALGTSQGFQRHGSGSWDHFSSPPVERRESRCLLQDNMNFLFLGGVVVVVIPDLLARNHEIGWETKRFVACCFCLPTCFLTPWITLLRQRKAGCYWNKSVLASIWGSLFVEEV